MERNQAIALLAACAPVVAAIDASSQGIYFHPNAQQLAALKGFEQVVTCPQAQQSELWLEEVRRHAGLRPSDMGLLDGVLMRHYLSQPGMVDDIIERLKRHFNLAE